MDVTVMSMLPLLLEGAKVTVLVAVLSGIVAFAAAVTAGLCKLSRWWVVRTATAVYVEVFRGTSLLVQLFWLYFALPFLGVELPKLLAAVLAVGLNYGAYGSEIVRSSILAVPKGQWEAAIALNMTPYERMTRIIFPQAFLRMLPPFGNLMIELIKSTSLVYFITLADLTYQAMLLRNNYYPMTPYIFSLLLLFYFVMAYTVSLCTRWVERKAAAGRM
ncbi:MULTISPECIES: ectoine/hydroxyectoine ABC transporter permease subunit EhuC [unclassified Paenibacillus]|uniref:ectoine/hydroxyectoine ABC transporter permease subunit EhuC n=1 Tax=unclassified Paenibacillus TaxID=185978 RepID=UPI001AE4286B|nr:MULTISPECIES: ectoine/hydroxyectoine ABC transporter permease subunit EhuC [unclassified Paenibacillus]MBP1157239.1 polar amino acid transport system permease protein [Paenibacillus sp. PvP091]MBP1172022.1 polar amino acid transport system permease protein [Paenibacillus sp. PvR098]MBP2438403.1 polar amino acid transport system permease protein [Paenibacillus sp. PvP052]